MSIHPFSFRGLFIFNSSGKLTISQRFTTVEMRAPKNISQIPTNDKMTEFFQQKVLPEIKSEANFVFDIAENTPLVVLPTKNDFISVIPLIESEFEAGKTRPEIPASFHFLSFLEPVFRTPLKNFAKQPNPAPIIQLINLVLPFGSPVIHDAYFVSQLPLTSDSHLFNAGYATVSPAPVPSWKTSLVFPRQQLEVKMRETIIGSIDGDKQMFMVFGELRSIASINYLPDVHIAISKAEKLKNVSAHFSVKEYKKGKLVLSPPTGITQLLLWQADVSGAPPVVGTYTTKEEPENGISFTINVKVQQAGISSVTVQLPFPDRGAVTKHQFQAVPSIVSKHSQIKMSKREATIAWTFDVTEEEPSLSGTLNFEKPCGSNERLRAFIEFKNKSSTYSGASVEESGVSVSSSGASVAVAIENSYATESKKYIIWGPSV